VMYIGGDTDITSGYLDLDDIQNFHGSYAGRRTKFAPGKSFSIFRTLLRIRILRIVYK